TETKETLLKSALKYVMRDEGRHVNFGALALAEYYGHPDFPQSDLRDREDLAYELSLLLRNRFLAHEIYEEFYAPFMTHKEWDEMVLNSPIMAEFRDKLFGGIVPNLRDIHLLSARMKPHYARLGLDKFFAGESAIQQGSDDPK